MYKITIEKPVIKFLEKHKWEKILFQFYDTFKKISINPKISSLDIKPMLWLKNSYRLRLWKYRIIYEIIEKEISISIFKADSRWSIYK